MRKQDPKNLGRTIVAIVLTICILAAIVIIISGCEPAIQEVSREAISFEHVEAHEEMHRILREKRDHMTGPKYYEEMETKRYIPESWKILYLIRYDDGSIFYTWEEVTKEVYEMETTK